jgi:lipopolysaccharide export system permease protein
MIIFWNFGISKIQIINFFIKISILLTILQILFTSLLVPTSQELSRSLMKESNIDFFESFIKPKKFNDSIRNFTIFVGNKKNNGLLENIYLKKDLGDESFQITYSKNGKFVQRGNNKFLELYNGQTINGSKKNISNFNFTKSDFSLSNLKADVVTLNKLQETSTYLLIRCVLDLNNIQTKFLIFYNSNQPIDMHNCQLSGIGNIYKELYKRFIIPFYIPILVLISLLLILYSKESVHYLKYRISIFFIGFIIIIFSETTLKFIHNTFTGNIKMILIPMISFIILYFLTLNILIKR